ncbi:hypothetical protein FPV67DRAFT_903159 [Lyophyllum atratum]|nr:hypothetical protein FPV67DRAFT_903159 [Lyophyllum atratum]
MSKWPSRSSLYARSALALTLKHPPILARLLTFIDWQTLHAVLDTSTQARDLFNDLVLRDIILARLVPGYDACRHPAANLDNLVSIDIHHLHLFLISQTFPVHLYPTHALRSLFSLHPNDSKSEPLASLTQAHSRFTLILQSLVHSSPSFSVPLEPPHAQLFEKISSSLPELSSPAPLCYKYSPSPIAPQLSSRLHSKPKSKLPSGSTRRLTIFKSRSSPQPPPPAIEPHALRAYSASWRRSWRSSASFRFASEPNTPPSDSDNELVPPRRRYVPSTPPSNSNSQSSLSRSSTPTPPTSTSSPSPPPPRFPLSPLSTPSPYDFAHATSPTRAPVLRVYVPCSSPTPRPEILIRCEEQLVNAELWAHLSVGDIVANLGHVPLFDESICTPKGSINSRRRSLRAPPPAPIPAENWMVFNGTFLVPFSATRAAPLPIPDALTLPSPFYYTHILSRLANPVFTLRRMARFSTSPHTRQPALPSADDIQMRLVHLPAKVPTAHGNGSALVRRYKWLARVFVHGPVDADEPELGAGWQSEWVLEGDGTKEGREALVDWLIGRGRSGLGKGKGKGTVDEEWEWEWELVRERCKKGRIWMK